jgi:hypothetical protein
VGGDQRRGRCRCGDDEGEDTRHSKPLDLPRFDWDGAERARGRGIDGVRGPGRDEPRLDGVGPLRAEQVSELGTVLPSLGLTPQDGGAFCSRVFSE